MTYRERRIARAERLQGWAEKRDTKASQAYDESHKAVEHIPFGQPILVGHHSEGKMRRAINRAQAKASLSIEHHRKAEQMRGKAANILSAVDRSIYSDDHDAIVRLEEKLAGLEAERGRIKAYNKSCKNGSPDVTLLDERQQRDLESCKRFGGFGVGDRGETPAYMLSNLSGNINRTRKRLEALKRKGIS